MKKLIIIFILCLGTLCAEAQQTLHSSYFLKRMPMRHKLNPALINDYGYFSIPMLGNVNIGVQSNLSLKNFIYPTNDGNLMTFMHQDVSADEFLDNIKNYNSVEMNVDMAILSFGFFGFKGYNTFDISLRSHTGIYIPEDLFRFMKLGMDNENGNSYRLRNFNMKTDNYVELALGHAHQINDKLTIGAKLKFLAGVANVRAKIHQMDITLSEDKWEIMANGQMDASVLGASLKTKASGEINDFDFDIDKPALSGWGLGTDLGATYKLMDELTLSAAVVDLGFIRWNKNLRGATRNDESFLFDGFDEIDINDDSSIDDQWDDIADQLEDMVRFYETDAPSSRSTSLRTTLNIGAEYSILNDKISFGLLSSTRFSSPKTWTEIVGSANFRPASWFNVAFTGTLSNYGPNWGWVLNLCPRGFNFFIGTDHMVTRLTPQYIPTKNATVNLNFGLNVPMGGPIRQARKMAKREDRALRREAKAVKNMQDYEAKALKEMQDHEGLQESADTLQNNRKSKEVNTEEDTPVESVQANAGTNFIGNGIMNTNSPFYTEETNKKSTKNRRY